MTHNKLVLFSDDIIYMNPVLLGELGYIGSKYGSLIEDNYIRQIKSINQLTEIFFYRKKLC